MDILTIIGLIITLLGTLASLYGAWISKKQAASAKESSNFVKKIKDEIIKRRETSEISRLNDKLEVSIQEIKIYGPVSSEEKLRGVDHLKIAGTVQDFLITLSSYIDLFKGNDKPKADSLKDELTSLLDEFGVEGKSLEELKESGKKILNSLNNFSPVLRKNLNKHVEK
ncbi:hypothetical protein [Halobacteriovorax sp. ZH1_bin.1]|uniref:hypothetical protein n=1 Tax=Halobacteriovorax sp. ZH1_bin.1 TaxID=3157723 RepID=UPI00371A7128